jgi:hypothetical protein
MGAGIAASPHCAERRICRCSIYLVPLLERFGTPLLDPGSPAQASLSIAPLPRERSPGFYSTAPPEGSLVFRRPACLSNPGLATQILEPEFPDRSPESQVPAKAVRCSAALLGKTALASRFAHHGSEKPGSRVALEAIFSSGASSRLARDEPESSSHSCRRRSVLLSLPRPSCRCRLSGETGTSAPIT